MASKVIVEPVQMAVSIEEARTAARVDGTEFDSQLEIDVRAFTKEAEHDTGRAIITQTWRTSLDSFPATIQLPACPVQSVVVKYIDPQGVEQTLPASDYILDVDAEPSTITLADGKSWPATAKRSGAVKVDSVCGYGPTSATTPPGFKAYILAQLQAKYTSTDAVGCESLLWPLKVYA